MKSIIKTAFVALLFGFAWAGDLPDVPGALNPDVTQATIHQTVCVSGWTKTVRPSVSVSNRIKREKLATLADKTMSDYELDHLISLQLGGAPDDPNNLWPEPYAGPCGARRKDRIETALKREVCAGKITLKQAQDAIRTNWIEAYRKYVGPLQCGE